MNEIKRDKNEIENELKSQLEDYKGGLAKETTELKQKLNEQEGRNKEMERKILQAKAESEKQDALKQQKLEHYESQIEEFYTKDYALQEELSRTKNQ